MERAVGVPEGGVGRNAENAAEDAGARGLRRIEEKGRKFFDEGGAVGADGIKKLRVAEGEMKSPVTAHGDAGNGAVGTAR